MLKNTSKRTIDLFSGGKIGIIMLPPFISYGIFGLCGFLVDYLLFNWCFAFTESLFFSRSLSYFTAITLTWFLNSHFTFRYYGEDRLKLQNFFRYFMSQVPSMGLNIGIHVYVSQLFEFSSKITVMIFLINGFVALVINFLLSKYCVFNR